MMDPIKVYEEVSWAKTDQQPKHLNRLGTDPYMLPAIKTRKLEYLRHIMRNYRSSFLQLIMHRKIEEEEIERMEKNFVIPKLKRLV